MPILEISDIIGVNNSDASMSSNIADGAENTNIGPDECQNLGTPDLSNLPNSHEVTENDEICASDDGEEKIYSNNVENATYTNYIKNLQQIAFISKKKLFKKFKFENFDIWTLSHF